jgi:dihydrofolate reductase
MMAHDRPDGTDSGAGLHACLAGADQPLRRRLCVGRLVYAPIASLDGYVADEAGRFDWAAPDEEVHAFVNDLVRAAGTHLYGRRTYDVLQVWETFGLEDDAPPVVRDFGAVWRAADKVVFSTTLASAPTGRTRVERAFDAEEVSRLTRSAVRDVTIGGPHLAAQAIRAGLVDDYHLLLAPVLVGGGTPALPDGVRVDLELVAQQRFASGFVHLHYVSRSTSPGQDR